jgi:predicted ribosomally synthesized peptide with SipW-like signal peptide
MPKKERDTMSKKTKRYLMLLVAVGLIAVAAGGSGTFATFNAEVTNNGNTFATGSLLLHNTANGTTCTSEAGAGNVNNLTTNGCSVLFNYNSVTDTSGVYEAHLTLTNAGTVEASGISFDAPSACNNTTAEGTSTLATALIGGSSSGVTLTINPLTGTIHTGDPVILTTTGHTQTFVATAQSNPGDTTITVTAQTANFSYPVNSAVGGPTFTPAGNLCANSQIVIVETDSSFLATIGNPAIGCAWPSSQAAGGGIGCAFSSGTTLADLPTAAGAGLTGLALGTATGNTLSHLSAGASRYFLIEVKPPTPLLNTYQNRAALFGLTWHIDQV